MALRIYTKTTESASLSVDGEFTLPLSVTIDGRTGGVVDQLLYVRNDENTRWYSDISVSAYSGSSTNLIDSSSGYGVKFSTGNKRPTDEEWALVSYANTASFSDDIGNAYDAALYIYLPFWIRIEVPGNQPAMVVKDIQIVLSATEHLI